MVSTRPVAQSARSGRSRRDVQGGERPAHGGMNLPAASPVRETSENAITPKQEDTQHQTRNLPPRPASQDVVGQRVTDPAATRRQAMEDRLDRVLPLRSAPTSRHRTQQPQEPEEVFRDPSPDPPQAPPNTPIILQRHLSHRYPLRHPQHVAGARREASEARLIHDLGTAYAAQLPPGTAFQRPWFCQHCRNLHHPLLAIAPSVTYYPFTPTAAGAPPHPPAQPHLPPHNTTPGFPLAAYTGRDLTRGSPTLPFISLEGGPRLPCFRRSSGGDRTDVGFGPGVRVAEGFAGVAGWYGRRAWEEVVQDQRALFGRRG